MNIQDLFYAYADAYATVESLKAEYPQLEKAEKSLEEIKKQIQEYAKKNNEEAYGFGYEVKLSERSSWDGKGLDGYAVAQPEILQFKSKTVVATIRKLK